VKQQYKDILRILGGKYNVYVLVLGLLSLFLLVIFFNPLARTAKILGVMAAFTVGNVLLKRWMLPFRSLPLEIELSTLSSVVATLAFGVKAGILLAVLTCFAGNHFTRGISLYTPMMASGYVLAALLAWFMAPASIVAGGIVITLIVNAYLIAIFSMVGYSPLENFLYGASNVVLNSILFLKVAPWLLQILT